MKCSFTDRSHSRTSTLAQTQLGQICGSRNLFHGRYQILRVLGRGGFGITFLAKNYLLPGHPFCVIKQLSPQVQGAEVLARARQRFVREAEMLGRLGSHAQIPHLLDYFEVEGEFFLVQEYIKGCTLARELRRTGPQSEAVVKQLLQELLPLLHYIHQHQVIHRDIKPQNIIRAEDDGRLVLIDFGAVKEQVNEVTQSTQSPKTQFIGTLGFAPLEQIGMRPVYASDLYALGVVCLCLLAHKPPLQFQTSPETGEILWQHEVQVSDRFAKVLSKLLAVSLQDRYLSAAAVMRDLNLEPYLELLQPCLSVQPDPLSNPYVDEIIEGYAPPIVRTAVAIRQWRAKQQLRQKRSSLYIPL